MALFDIDKSSDDRGSPMPNVHDQLAHDAVMSKGTNSIHYSTAATPAAFRQTSTTNGIKQPLTATIARVNIPDTAGAGSIYQTNVPISGSLKNISFEASVVPPYYLNNAVSYSYTIFNTPYIGKEFVTNPSAWVSISASSKGQPQTINFYVIPINDVIMIGDWIFTYYIYRQNADLS